MTEPMPARSSIILVRGGGDLASGVIARLWRAGLKVLVTELARPLVVRRSVSFAEAIYAGSAEVEGLRGRRVATIDAARAILADGELPVLVDPDLECLQAIRPLVLVDARLVKRPPETGRDAAALVVGLGPGFSAGVDCHAVVETLRGHNLGRVYWQGTAAKDTGVPESREGRQDERVLRAPADGVMQARAAIGDILPEGAVVAEVGGLAVKAPFGGLVRGLLYSGVQVQAGMKIGDMDPRSDPTLCQTISDKALAIGGGVLEAILSRAEIREQLWVRHATD